MAQILVGTIDGLHRVGIESGPEHGGREVTALGAEYPSVWAILDGSEVWRAGEQRKRACVRSAHDTSGVCIPIGDGWSLPVEDQDLLAQQFLAVAIG